MVSVDPGDMRTAMHQAAFPDEDISDRPLPEVTLPFWAWLLNQDPLVLRKFEMAFQRCGVLLSLRGTEIRHTDSTVRNC